MDRHVNCDLPFVHSYRDRHGRWRYYFRRKGRTVPLPAPPGSPQFVAAYNAALTETAKTAPGAHSAPGTLDALRELYFSSAEFSNLASTTQREVRYVVENLCRTPNTKGEGKRGDNPVKALESRHILAWRDKMKDTPGAANKMIRVVKAWLSFGVPRGFRLDNPARGIKMLKIGSFRDWTDDELEQFERRWPLGSLERTGFALALYTAQRRADLVNMKWSAIAGDWIRVKQSKTGIVVELPIHPELAEALATWRLHAGSETILTGAKKRPLNPIYFGHIMAEAIEDAGLPNDCVLHGLRKSAARIVAELGGKVGSMTGHITEQMEQQYSRRADQKRNAKAAVIAWGKAVRKRNKQRARTKGESG